MYTLADITAICRGARDFDDALAALEEYFGHKIAAAEAAKKWKGQGSRSKWSTPESLALWDAVDELEKHEKELESE